ncbi:MAG: hypothetical protein ACK5P3_21210 [Dolichospermum sp.]
MPWKYENLNLPTFLFLSSDQDKIFLGAINLEIPLLDIYEDVNFKLQED